MAERVAFRGGLTCSCVVASLPWVEADMLRLGIISNKIDLYQLGYRDDVSASAGTHSKGGCTDTGQFSAAAIDVWRLWGWTMQDRSPFFELDHGHGWPYGCPHLSDAAKAQNTDWNNRRNGLVNGGPVVGRWPVKTWSDALSERKKIIMAFVDDIARAVATELGSNDAFKTKLAMSVRNLVLGVNDGGLGDVIPTWHPDGEGGNWRLQELLRAIRGQQDVEADVEGRRFDAQDKQLAAILAAVQPPPADPTS